MSNSFEKALAKAEKALPKAEARYAKLCALSEATTPEDGTDSPYEDKASATYEKVADIEDTIRLCNEVLRLSAYVPDELIVTFITANKPDKLEDWATALADFMSEYAPPTEPHTRYWCEDDLKALLIERFKALKAERKRSA